MSTIMLPRERFFGSPWVFQRLRHWALGGFSFAPGYKLLEVQERDVVLDVGCGMGDAMRHLGKFREYHGFDIDSRAIDSFRKRCLQPNVHLYSRRCESRDIGGIAPSKVVLVGLLHHISDREALDLLRPLADPPHPRILTIDTIFLPGHWTNNLLARFDRGRYVRTMEQYQALAHSAGLVVQQSFWIETGWHATRYYGMILGSRRLVEK